jgi:membrane protease YdiL (CAAX protease family)
VRQVLLRTMAVWAGIFVVALVARGSHGLFWLPRTRPGLWLAIVLLYPIFSVYPQEVMYRTFFWHRYAAILRRPAALILVNAAVFGWAHIIVHNLVAILMTAVGGVLFGLTYERSRSTLLVAFEHALYGGFVFSVGIGGMFVNGVRLMSRVLH